MWHINVSVLAGIISGQIVLTLAAASGHPASLRLSRITNGPQGAILYHKISQNADAKVFALREQLSKSFTQAHQTGGLDVNQLKSQCSVAQLGIDRLRQKPELLERCAGTEEGRDRFDSECSSFRTNVRKYVQANIAHPWFTHHVRVIVKTKDDRANSLSEEETDFLAARFEVNRHKIFPVNDTFMFQSSRVLETSIDYGEGSWAGMLSAYTSDPDITQGLAGDYSPAARVTYREEDGGYYRLQGLDLICDIYEQRAVVRFRKSSSDTVEMWSGEETELYRSVYSSLISYREDRVDSEKACDPFRNGTDFGVALMSHGLASEQVRQRSPAIRDYFFDGQSCLRQFSSVDEFMEQFFGSEPVRVLFEVSENILYTGL